MAQHDYVIDNQSFPATRTDLNNVLQAIVSNNSGTSAPSTTFANQIWYDTSANILYIRNEDNDANIPLFLLDQSADVAATIATIIDVLDVSGTDQAGTALTIRGGAGTGTGAGGSIIFQTADGAGSTGSSVNAHATQVTITDDGKVGIGTTTPSHALNVAGTNARIYLTGANEDIDMSGTADGQLHLDGNGYAGAIALNATGMHLYHNSSSLPLIFGTNETENARMLSTGTMLIGTTNTNPVTSNVAGILFQGSTGAGQFSRTNNPALFLNRGNDGVIQQFYRAGVSVGRIMVTSSATSYLTTSDYRLKENVTDITDGITRVKQLDPKRFNFIVEPDTTVDGFLAHEVADIVPEAIFGEKDATEPVGNVTDANGNTTETGVVEPDELATGHTWTATGTQAAYQSIDQAKLVPLLTAALQEAIAKIEALETRVAALEG